MSPWLPDGAPEGKGKDPVTLPRPGHADLAGVLKYEHNDVRNALERASARHTAVIVAAGAAAKALLGEIDIEVEGTVVALQLAGRGAGGDQIPALEAVDALLPDGDLVPFTLT